jgi:hypothetical protein
LFKNRKKKTKKKKRKKKKKKMVAASDKSLSLDNLAKIEMCPVIL